jgi:probable HAF family extracellular repeat protein
MDHHHWQRFARQRGRMAVWRVFVLFMLASGGSALAQSPYRLTLLNPGDGSMVAVDINNAAEVALNVYGPQSATGVVTWDGTAFTDLGAGVPYAINSAGQVAGYRTDSQGVARATVWDRAGTPTSISTEPATALVDSPVFDINDRGQAVGLRSLNGHRATLWNAGGAVDLGLGQAWGINNAGQIVGLSFESMTLPTRAALWDANGLTLLAGPGSRAQDINDLGQIVGSSGSQAQLWEGGRSVDLGTLGGSFSVAAAINNAGQITGYFSSPDGLHAALWTGALGVDLNSLLRPQSVADGWILTTATGINDNGWIVGTARNRFDCADGECAQYGFVLSLSNLPDQVLAITAAVPEPSTYTLMLAGLGALGMWAQRRRMASASK